MTNPPRAYINAGGTHPRMSRFEIWISRRGNAHEASLRHCAHKRPCTIVTPHNTSPTFLRNLSHQLKISLHDRCDARRGKCSARRIKITRAVKRHHASRYFSALSLLQQVTSRVFLVKSGKVIRSTMTVTS